MLSCEEGVQTLRTEWVGYRYQKRTSWKIGLLGSIDRVKGQDELLFCCLNQEVSCLISGPVLLWNVH